MVPFFSFQSQSGLNVLINPEHIVTATPNEHHTTVLLSTGDTIHLSVEFENFHEKIASAAMVAMAR